MSEAGAPTRAAQRRHIEARERRRQRILHGEDEVRRDEAVEARRLQVGQQRRALAGLRSVESVVGAHDRVGVRLADGALERRLVDLLQRALGDVHVDAPTAPAAGLVEADTPELLVVGDVMLERRDHVGALGARDLLSDGLAREERVLAEVLGLAPAERGARERNAPDPAEHGVSRTDSALCEET
jgi:hypothetical protein